MKRFIGILLGCYLFISCSKDEARNEPYCYECRGINNELLGEGCAPNKDSAFRMVVGGTYNGEVMTTMAQFDQHCPQKP